MNFYGRLPELSLLNHLYERSPSFVVITGRRRIGKTELIKRFMGDHDGIYFFVDSHKSIDLLLTEFTKALGEKLNLPSYISFKTPEEFLEFLFEIDHRFIVVFDEFQRFLDIYPPFITQLQKFWDLKGRSSNLFLMISGSSIGMMRKIFIDSKSPLFRRADSIITLNPFKVTECLQIMYDIGIRNQKEQMNIYMLFGGIIFYYHILEKFGCKTFKDTLQKLIFSDLAPLSHELSALLIEEFGGSHLSYYEILGALAEGRATQKTIADLTHIAPNSLSPYLNELTDILGIIEYRIPVTENTIRSKKGRYFLKDPFIRFYSRFIYPNQSRYAIGQYDALMKKVLQEWDGFAGHIFEDIVREQLSVHLSHEFDKIGPWWNRRGDEIDLVATGPSGSLVLEIKNRIISRNDGTQIIEGLQKKIDLVQGITHPVRLGLAGRSLEGKEEYHKNGIRVFDLKDVLDLAAYPLEGNDPE